MATGVTTLTVTAMTAASISCTVQPGGHGPGSPQRGTGLHPSAKSRLAVPVVPAAFRRLPGHLPAHRGRG
jgi:hypothetical protein